MTNVFLGYPSEHIKNWIIEHSSKEQAGHEKTWIWFAGDAEDTYTEFDWSGEINQQTMTDAGLFDPDDYGWPRNPVKVEIGTKITSIGESAFSECTSLTSITIPDSVTSIGENAFCDCDSLTSVTIGNGVTNIGTCAFYYCSSLTSITIPDSVTSIGDSALSYCSSLTTITIPDSVEIVGDNAFYGCYDLTSVTIPNSVTSIEGEAFFGCSNLTSVSILGFTQAQIIENALKWQLGYKYNDDWTDRITFPITMTTKDGTFVLHQS